MARELACATQLRLSRLEPNVPQVRRASGHETAKAGSAELWPELIGSRALRVSGACGFTRPVRSHLV